MNKSLECGFLRCNSKFLRNAYFIEKKRKFKRLTRFQDFEVFKYIVKVLMVFDEYNVNVIV